ncbi:hypothetical protein V6N12_014216 [Hibiscus sabdariffa]|uniref:Secreted protein n=1 Tax=Hibiscus sabdariffa TaxID=183260 RepID=A0ABR2DJH9_9ROSI
MIRLYLLVVAPRGSIATPVERRWNSQRSVQQDPTSLPAGPARAACLLIMPREFEISTACISFSAWNCFGICDSIQPLHAWGLEWKYIVKKKKKKKKKEKEEEEMKIEKIL